jgi:hypothetical protein
VGLAEGRRIGAQPAWKSLLKAAGARLGRTHRTPSPQTVAGLVSPGRRNSLSSSFLIPAVLNHRFANSDDVSDFSNRYRCVQSIIRE